MVRSLRIRSLLLAMLLALTSRAAWAHDGEVCFERPALQMAPKGGSFSEENAEEMLKQLRADLGGTITVQVDNDGTRFTLAKADKGIAIRNIDPSRKHMMIVRNAKGRIVASFSFRFESSTTPRVSVFFNDFYGGWSADPMKRPCPFTSKA